jgi:hypothetical protein
MMHNIQHDDEDSENGVGIYCGSSILHWTGEYTVLLRDPTRLLTTLSSPPAWRL